jgi:hypothetical protein
MADQNSNQYASAYVTEPRGKLDPNELNGRVRNIFADITLSAEIATTDTVFLHRLPANSTIKSCRLFAPGGTAGTLDLGWNASADGGEAADPNGLLPGIAGNAAVDLTMDLSNQQAGYRKKFSEPVDIILSTSVLSAGWSGDLVQLELEYIID